MIPVRDLFLQHGVEVEVDGQVADFGEVDGTGAAGAVDEGREASVFALHEGAEVV